MAYQKVYRAIVPIQKEGTSSDALLVWLTRESFDRAAANDSVVLISFTDMGEVAPADIPPKVDKQMGRPASEYVWRSFEGVGERVTVDA